MRFVHVSDLHLGKRLNDIPLLEDQKHALRQILDITVSEKADAILIAGDIYDIASPPGEAMSAFDDFITRLAEQQVKVFVISGNHDSDRRISYYSSLVKNAGVYVSECFEGRLQTFAAEDEFGELCVHLLPFIKPVQVRRFFPAEKIETYNDAVRTVLENSDIDREKRNILLCHQFITGADRSDSEEFSVGGIDNVDASLFDEFDYVALGHLHKPQKVGRDTVRYSGSPFKYSLSEAANRKSVTVVTVGEKGDTAIKTVPLSHLHDVREIEGSFDEVMKLPYSEDYVRVTVLDEIVPPDAHVHIASVFPNMMKFGVRNSKTRYEADTANIESVENKSVTELFEEFYRLQSGGEAPSDEHLKIFNEILRCVEEAEYEAD